MNVGNTINYRVLGNLNSGHGYLCLIQYNIIQQSAIQYIAVC